MWLQLLVAERYLLARLRQRLASKKRSAISSCGHILPADLAAHTVNLVSVFVLSVCCARQAWQEPRSREYMSVE